MNVFNKPLKLCSIQPLTGYNRKGFCQYIESDYGNHIVCAKVDNNFLNFTKSKGNDLITPSHSFPGLKQGDKWCLCMGRWLEAYNSGVAPKIYPESTSIQILNYISFNALQQYFI